MERDNIPDKPAHELPQEAMQVVITDLRDVMVQYSNCVDPSESAARKERYRQAEIHGEVEGTAAGRVRRALIQAEEEEEEKERIVSISHERRGRLHLLNHHLGKDKSESILLNMQALVEQYVDMK